jgi:hypothetical protein
MSKFKEVVAGLIHKISPSTPVIWKEGNTVYVDAGEVPWLKKAILVFPSETHITILPNDEDKKIRELKEEQWREKNFW